MLIKIKDKATFKKENRLSWEQNTSFWLNHQLLDYNIQEFITKSIYSLVASSVEEKLLIDLGCGSGWLLDSIMKNSTSKYLGIDYNYKFIEHLQTKYEGSADFRNLDIEETFHTELAAKGNIVINCLNLIETADLENVFKNISFITKKGGTVMIVFLNPIVEIIRDSSNIEEFNHNLEFYRKVGNETVISKKIVSNGEESDSMYYRILYSMKDFVRLALANDFCITEINSLFGVNEKNGTPPLFEFIFLRK